MPAITAIFLPFHVADAENAGIGTNHQTGVLHEDVTGEVDFRHSAEGHGARAALHVGEARSDRVEAVLRIHRHPLDRELGVQQPFDGSRDKFAEIYCVTVRLALRVDK